MAIDFTSIKSITIPEGDVVRISQGGNVLWEEKPTGTYYKFDTDTLYLAGTAKQGYTQYLSDSTILRQYAPNTKHLVTESVIILPNNCNEMLAGFCNIEDTSLDLSNWDVSNVTNMRRMINFDYVTQAHSVVGIINLSGWDTSKVTNMAALFSDMQNLKHIYVDSNWNTDLVSASSSMFYGCINLHNFDSSYTDKTKAIIDNGSNGGYLEQIT